MNKTGLIVANCRVVVKAGTEWQSLRRMQRKKWSRRSSSNGISRVVRRARLMLIGC